MHIKSLTYCDDLDLVSLAMNEGSVHSFLIQIEKGNNDDDDEEDVYMNRGHNVIIKRVYEQSDETYN